MNATRQPAEIAQHPLAVREIGSFHAGGRLATLKGCTPQKVSVARNGPERIVDLNGDYITGQCYVQFVKLVEPRQAFPVLFLHGGAMTGVAYETTPDGRPGWQSVFLHAGFDTYVADAVERGRAGWSPYPQIYSTEPIFRTLNEAWELFRIGSPSGYCRSAARREPFEHQQFPVACFDDLGAQFVPRWTDHGELTLEAYGALLERIGPVFLVAHSQGANLALDLVQRHPEQIRALTAVEPASAPPLRAETATAAAAVPHLFVWGDFFEHSELWRSYRATTESYSQTLEDNGGQFDILDLPQQGITGNSHLPMMDRNSDQVAQLILDWVERQESRAS